MDYLCVCIIIEREMDEKSIAEAVPLKFDENTSRQVSKHAKCIIICIRSVYVVYTDIAYSAISCKKQRLLCISLMVSIETVLYSIFFIDS